MKYKIKLSICTRVKDFDVETAVLKTWCDTSGVTLQHPAPGQAG